MININIPGYKDLYLSHIVTDYNGTLAVDGILIPGVKESLIDLSSLIEIHVITADTFGLANSQLSDLPVNLTIAARDSQAEAKLALVTKLGADNVVAIGNGRNDRKMLKAASIGIALIQKECSALETIINADIVSTNINDALGLLLNTKRMIATLRT